MSSSRLVPGRIAVLRMRTSGSSPGAYARALPVGAMPRRAAAARRHRMALGLQVPVRAIQPRPERLDGEIEIGEAALAGDALDQLDRRTCVVLSDEDHVAHGALDAVEDLAAVGGRESFGVML